MQNEMKKVLMSCFFLLFFSSMKAQYSYGTTGLLNSPTADMQQDKTFMFGGSYLDNHTSTARWFYNTWNYYINVTIFPWLEVSYNMELHKALAVDPALESGYWVPRTYGKFVNQDRQFSARLRLWKEGWWKSWTPQIVFGWDDVSSHSWGDTGKRFSIEDTQGNSFNNRLYLAATKHFAFKGAGNLGAHLSYLYNKRSDYPLNGVAVGVNFRLGLPEEKCGFNKFLNGFNFMAEAYPADGRGTYWDDEGHTREHYDRGVAVGKYDINIGASYSIWKDHINLIGELYGCQDFSGGVQFKVHL
jgi:hypothetical protein